jgi:hypothetical protein
MESVNRLRRADQIIGASAILFFIFLFFFKWYGGSTSSSIGGQGFSISANGWHTFTNSRWIWIITIIVALVSVAISAGMLKLQSPVHPGAIVAGLGALSTLLILYRIINHPSGATSGSIAGVHFSASYGIKIGIWLGLIAAAALTYGGYLKMQEDGTSISDVRDQASGAVSSMSSSGGADTSASAPPPPPAAATPASPPAAAETAAPPLPPPAPAPGAESAGGPTPAQ